MAALTKAGERVHDYLGNDSDHFFVAPCLMMGLLTVLAVVASVLVWQRREQRGPAMAVALSIGLVGAAAAAVGVGALVVRLRYGALDFGAIPLSSDHKVAYVIEAPPVLFGHGAAAGGAHPWLAGRRRRAGVCRAGGRERPRRPRRLPAGGTGGRHSGRR